MKSEKVLTSGFLMCYRASGCSSMLENLDVEAEQILKCTAHVFLGVSSAANNVFRHVEQTSRVQEFSYRKSL